MATSVAKNCSSNRERVALIGAPEGYPAALDPLPEGVELVAEPQPDHDIFIVFVRDSAAVTDERATWVAYPKGGHKAGTDLHRDIPWQAMTEIGRGHAGRVG